jgi:hypothetical protein
LPAAGCLNDFGSLLTVQPQHLQRNLHSITKSNAESMPMPFFRKSAKLAIADMQYHSQAMSLDGSALETLEVRLTN